MLSLLLPGLGQAWAGARRRGILIALPVVGGVAALLVGIVLDPVGALDTLLTPGILVLILVLIVAIGIYHLAAIQDAYRTAARVPPIREPATAPATAPAPAAAAAPRRRASRSPLLVMALAVALVVYGTVEFIGVRAYQAASAIFVGPSGGFVIPEASFSARPTTTPAPPTGPVTEPPPPTPTPIPVPSWAADGRLNLLLIGSDAGPGRWLARTDTMVLLTVDVASGRAALIGVPRNMVNVPLSAEFAGGFPNGRFPEFINGLYVYVVNRPEQFPGGEAAGFRAVTGAIQELVGQPLDGALVVNLNGFVDLVDAVGGLWLDLPYSVYDARYPLSNGTGYIEIFIPAGCQKLSGERALQYARTRHMDSDYGRMQRQQRVLVGLARQLDPIALLPQVPDLLEIARDNLWTTIEPNEIANLAVLAARVDAGEIQTIQLSPPTYPEYLTTKTIQRIHDRVATVFDEPAASPSPTPKSTPRPCPRPKP